MSYLSQVFLAWSCVSLVLAVFREVMGIADLNWELEGSLGLLITPIQFHRNHDEAVQSTSVHLRLSGEAVCIHKAATRNQVMALK